LDAVTERIVSESRNRQTGTTILVVDRGADDVDTLAGWDRWETICEEHGTVCSHATRRLAHSFSHAPLEWCEPCMAQHDQPKED
jgi:nicotinic acid mononucleotide adenylyltransferase